MKNQKHIQEKYALNHEGKMLIWKQPTRNMSIQRGLNAELKQRANILCPIISKTWKKALVFCYDLQDSSSGPSD